jgi:hypothetical protein
MEAMTLNYAIYFGARFRFPVNGIKDVGQFSPRNRLAFISGVW